MAAFSGYSCGCCSAPGREAGVGVESDVPLYECESQGEEALLVATFSGYSCGCCSAPGREAGVGVQSDVPLQHLTYQCFSLS